MKKTFCICLCYLVFSSCKTNSYTGKKTLNFYGNKTVFPVAFKEYSSFLEENPPISNTAESLKIKEIGRKITAAAKAYYSYKGNSHLLDDYAWEYNLVKNNQRNAWCMPGGKIVFYTGILPIAKTDAGIAAIMGHEVAHALADHGAQRMTASTVKSGLDVILKKTTENQSERKRKQILSAYGYGSQLGILLPFSRKHETEADKIGVELMVIAGYDPQEAANVWRRMQAAHDGKSPPEILSTHPSNEKRIQHITAHIPQAKALAKKMQK